MGDCLRKQSSPPDLDNGGGSNHRLEHIPQLSGQAGEAPQLQSQQKPIRHDEGSTSNGAHGNNAQNHLERFQQFTCENLVKVPKSFTHGCIVGVDAFGGYFRKQSSSPDLENRGRSNHRLEHIPQLSGQAGEAPQLQSQQEPIQNHQEILQQFSYEELANATLSFSHDCIVGVGGFGEVYMGKIGNQTAVAIKRLQYQASQQQEAAFMKEIKALGTVNHENLVKLIGYCCEGRDRLIVCEYCPNLSLRLHLHETETVLPWGNRMGIVTLPWERRMQIAIGSAKGLHYLHEVCHPKIIHRDIKPDNIVLDINFKAKVVDFGLAKFFPESGSKTHISSLIKGAKVYADPEYGTNKKVLDKSDVFSFGVVLLELISGKKPKTNGVSILEWAKPLIKKVAHGENEITELIDPKLRAIYNEEEMRSHKSEMEILIFCAAASVYKPSKKRPQMKQIAEALEMKILTNEIWETNRDSVFLEPIPRPVARWGCAICYLQCVAFENFIYSLQKKKGSIKTLV